MKPRFVVHESEGFLAGYARDRRRQPGATVTVLDSLDVYRVVALFRSEDQSAGTVRRRKRLARRKAINLAGRLNRWDRRASL